MKLNITVMLFVEQRVHIMRHIDVKKKINYSVSFGLQSYDALSKDKSLGNTKLKCAKVI